MMCQSIGLPPISTMGFGRTAVSSLSREPNPPAKMTAFTAMQVSRRSTPPVGRSTLPHIHHLRGARRERVVGLRFGEHAELVAGRTPEPEAIPRAVATVGV